MADMEILISVGLLVAVAAWGARLCHRLFCLRAELRGAWEAWMQDTRSRNETLEAFAELFSLLMPAGEMQPRTLRRLVADSERLLRAGEALLWQATAAECTAEGELRRAAELAARTVEERAALRGHESLGPLCERLLTAMERQSQSGARLQAAAEAYNAALQEPPARLVAPGMGFLRAFRGRGQ